MKSKYEEELKTLEAITGLRKDVEDIYKPEDGYVRFNLVFNKAMDEMEDAAVFRMTARAAGAYDFSPEELIEIVKDISEKASAGNNNEAKGNADVDRDEGQRGDGTSINLGKEKTVVFYTPGYGPTVGIEGLLGDAFDPSDEGYREMRFLETDFLICFNSDDVVHLWGNYYLTGPAMIYAVDEHEEVRSLTEEEIVLIFSICKHKESRMGMKPAFRLC